jgi:polyisoprenoid-binding protein YceI
MRPAIRTLLTAAIMACTAACPVLSGAAAAAGAATAHYVLDQAKSSLEFTFLQAGAQNKGRFTRFPVTFDFSPADPTTGRLEVTVEVTSLDTGDHDRDETLRSADLLDVSKFPRAHFLATQFSRTAAGFEAVGKLTIRDVTRDVRVPFTFRTAAENGTAVGYMSGKTSVRRLDYGVGQGDWKATDQVANEVGVAFSLRLTAH